MKSSTTMFALLAMLVAFGGAPTRIEAQALPCEGSDFHCLDEEFTNACKLTEGDTRCVAFLDRLEQTPSADRANLQVTAALTYWELAEREANPNEAEAWRQRAITGLRAQYALNPRHVNTLRALAVFSEDINEQRAYLRQLLDVEPADILSADHLAKIQVRSGEVSEAARLMEDTYWHIDSTDRNRWYVASKAIEYYEISGEFERAQGFKQAVSAREAWEEYRDEIGLRVLDSPEAAFELIDEVCFLNAMKTLGSSTCLELVLSTKDLALASALPDARRRFADVFIGGFGQLRLAPDFIEANPDHTAQFRSHLEALISEQIETATVYIKYAPFLEDAAAEREAYLKAVSLEPTNGYAWHQLGLHYFYNGMWDEAVDAFTTAKLHTTDEARLTIQDQFIGRALEEARYGRN